MRSSAPRHSRLKRSLRWLMLAASLAAGGWLAWEGYRDFRLSLIRPAEANFNLAASRLGPVMVVIPAGSFTMGSPKTEQGRISDEGPQHTVRIAGFALGRYEVTFDEYDEFAKATGRDLPGDAGWGRGRRPVIGVSWEDANAYAEWLSKETGQRYRLPSEAEWEYAARGRTSFRYYWGDDPADESVCRYANGYDASLACSDGYPDRTAPVGRFEDNDFGLQDTLGNVWEWVEDCDHDSYEGAPADGSPWVSGGCRFRVLRGGSWGHGPDNLRAAYRLWYYPDWRDDGVGFRLARDLP